MSSRDLGISSAPRFIILADDLSGAADCVAGHAGRGISTAIDLGAEQETLASVLVIDTDSRHLPPEQAASVCLATWRKARAPHARLYKKIDSTLRGSWVSEVAALVPEAGMAIVAPALPAMGRVTRNARQYIDDMPVEDTEVWRNEGLTGQTDIQAMLSASGLEARRLTLPQLRQWSLSALREWLSEQRYNGVTAVVCDSESEADLQRLADASIDLPSVFWVGSAGLAQSLGHHLQSADSTVPASPTVDTIDVDGPILIVVGSMSGVSRGQVRTLLARADGRIRSVAVEARDVLASPEVPEALRSARAALAEGDDVLVTLVSGGPDPAIDGQALSERLGTCLGGTLDALGGLIATGGETARALLDAGGIARLRLMGELEPGVVLSLSPRGLPIITKAGGFGEASSLHAAWRHLQRRRQATMASGAACRRDLRSTYSGAKDQ